MKFFLVMLLVGVPCYSFGLGNGDSEIDKSYLRDFKVLYHLYEECSSKEWSSCLKIKLISAMDRLAKSYKTIQLVDGVSLSKDDARQTKEDSVNEDVLEMNLPRSSDARDISLNNMLFDKMLGFFSAYNLQVKLPTVDEMKTSMEEGRGKKHRGLLLIPLLFAGSLLPVILAGLALLAGKALVISKLALLLAGVIGLKKLLTQHHEGGGRRAYSSVKQDSLQVNNSSQSLAYSSYAPQRD